MVYLKKSCCGCSLKDGTLIIGALGLTSSVISLLSAFVKDRSSPELKSKEEMIGNLIGEVIGCLIEIVVHGLLVAGNSSGNKNLMLPWIVLNILGMIILAFVCIFIIPVGLYMSESAAAPALTLSFIIILVIGLGLYILLVVMSRYEELKLAELGEQNNLLPMHLTPMHKTSYESTVNASPSVPLENDPKPNVPIQDNFTPGAPPPYVEEQQ